MRKYNNNPNIPITKLKSIFLFTNQDIVRLTDYQIVKSHSYK